MFFTLKNFRKGSMHECFGGRKVIALTSDFPVKRMAVCNLLEHDLGESYDGQRAEFVMKPFEIKTIKMYF